MARAAGVDDYFSVSSHGARLMAIQWSNGKKNERDYRVRHARQRTGSRRFLVDIPC